MELSNDDIEAARFYHEVTKHSYSSVRTAVYSLDWNNKPLPYKIYPDAAAVALPRDLNLSAIPALQALAMGTLAPGAAPLNLQSLTRVLFCAAGLTRRRRVDGEDYHFRAAASAGALYPIETYLCTGDLDGLEPGLYHFSPADLRLRGLRRGDWRATIARAAAMRPSIRGAAAVLVLSAIFWRSAWKYRARCYRYCFWDAGTMLSNLLAAANAEGLDSEVITAFADPELEQLLAIDPEREGLVCLVALGKATQPPGEEPEITPLQLETVPLSSEEIRYDDLLKMHRASSLQTAEQASRLGRARLEPIAPPTAQLASSRTLKRVEPGSERRLGETILRRGSTRVFARGPITEAELSAILSVSSQHPPCDFPALSETYLIVNAVEGVTPGAYYYSRERDAIDLLKAGDFRREAGYLCLEQPLGADCSVLICYMADLERVLRALGNRGYRDVHLEAGILGGRAYVAAYALGRGATGLTFYDDDTAEFFSPHAAGKSPLLMVAAGVPAPR